MPKLLIFDAFTLLIPEKTVANYALLRCKTFSLKIWVCKIFDKFHVCSLDDGNIDDQCRGPSIKEKDHLGFDIIALRER